MRRLVNAAIAIRLGWKNTGEKWIRPGGGSQFDPPDFLNSNKIFQEIKQTLGFQSSFDACGWYTRSAWYVLRDGVNSESVYGNWDHKDNHTGCRCLLKFLRLHGLKNE